MSTTCLGSEAQALTGSRGKEVVCGQVGGLWETFFMKITRAYIEHQALFFKNHS